MSYLYHEGTVPYNYTFDTNGTPHLFSEISYEMNGVVIDSTIKPGIVSTAHSSKTILKGLEKQVSTLLRFAEDYRKVIVNTRQELILIRSNSADPKVIIDRIFWKVLHITAGFAQEFALTKYIDKSVDPKSRLQVGVFLESSTKSFHIHILL